MTKKLLGVVEILPSVVLELLLQSITGIVLG